MLPKRCKFLNLIVPCQMEYFFPLENVVGLQPKLSLGKCQFRRCFVLKSTFKKITILQCIFGILPLKRTLYLEITFVCSHGSYTKVIY